MKKIVPDWGMSTVQGDSANLEKFMDDNSRRNAEGISFNKKMLHAALKAGQMKVTDWTIEDVKVSINGNTASANARNTLINATYMGQDYSGNWVFTDRFMKQRDGSWRAVSLQSMRIKQ